MSADPFRQLVQQNFYAFEKDPLFRPHADFAFERIKKIGEGGMGQVYKIFDRRTRREAALKVLTEVRDNSGPRRAQRFIREARVTAALDHPAIPAILEFGRSGAGELYILMKLIEGQTLAEKIQEFQQLRRQGEDAPRAPLTELLRVMLRVCEALSYAHAKGILHRDLKPENVMIGRHGEVYVMDWGIARDLNESSEADQNIRELETQIHGSIFGNEISGRQAVVGSFGYLSPEQAASAPLDERSDIYALGAILFEMLTGRVPVAATGMAGVVAAMEGRIEIPPDFGRGFPTKLPGLIRRCLAKDRDRRPDTVEAVLEQLRAILGGLAAHKAPRRRRGVGALVALTALALSGVGLALYFWGRGQAESAALLAARRDLARLEEAMSAATPKEEAVAALRRALAAASEGRQGEAIQAFTEALEIDPRSAEAFRGRAQAYRALGRREPALADLKRALALAPEDGEARFERGLFQLEGESWRAALKDLDAAISAGYRRAPAYLARARARLELGRGPEALSDLDLALEQNSGLVEGHSLRGLARESCGDFDGALAAYDEALQLDARLGSALVRRGLFLVKLGRYEESVEQLEQAIERAPKAPETAEARRRLPEIQALAARPQRSKTRELRPALAAALTIGDRRVDGGELDEAIKAYEEALKLDPKAAETYLSRGRVYAQMKKNAAAMADLSKSIELRPDDLRAYLNRSLLFRLRNEFEKALSDLKTARRLEPDPVNLPTLEAAIRGLEAELKRRPGR